MVILEVVKSLNDKTATNMIWNQNFLQWPFFEFFFFRERNFSLKIQAIRPSAFFRTRRKAALCGEGFVWVPDLRSFLKLREVRGFSLLGFYTLFKCFSMFQLA